MIDFELEPQILTRLRMYQAVSEHMMRPISRDYDEHVHAMPSQFCDSMWSASACRRYPGRQRPEQEPDAARAPPLAPTCNPSLARRSYAGETPACSFPPPTPDPEAPHHGRGDTGTERAFSETLRGATQWGAMAITEPDSVPIRRITTTATRDGDHWVINGTKIFVPPANGSPKSEGFVVVWATSMNAGRPGIKPFVVEHHTPGMTVARVENKLGIRASDTAMLVFDNCRVPPDHLLGSAAVRGRRRSKT